MTMMALIAGSHSMRTPGQLLETGTHKRPFAGCTSYGSRHLCGWLNVKELGDSREVLTGAAIKRMTMLTIAGSQRQRPSL
jgi:hypothetical protein